MKFLEQDLDSAFVETWFDGFDDSFIMRRDCEKTLHALIEKTRHNGGVLQSRLWRGVDTRVTLTCRQGHVWVVTARPVLYHDSWCPACAFDSQWSGHQGVPPRRSFKGALLLAEQNGVAHLGEATTIREKTKWRCSNGHEWTEPARAILIRGFFCQQCQGRPAVFLRRARQTALIRGGRCLSTKYVNNHTNMEWECVDGHVWSAPYKNVVTNGTWCLECANEARRKPGRTTNAPRPDVYQPSYL